MNIKFQFREQITSRKKTCNAQFQFLIQYYIMKNVSRESFEKNKIKVFVHTGWLVERGCDGPWSKVN